MRLLLLCKMKSAEPWRKLLSEATEIRGVAPNRITGAHVIREVRKEGVLSMKKIFQRYGYNPHIPLYVTEEREDAARRVLRTNVFGEVERGASFRVIDGNHRLAAMTELSDENDPAYSELTLRVVHTTDAEQLSCIARYLNLQNTHFVKTTVYDTMKEFQTIQKLVRLREETSRIKQGRRAKSVKERQFYLEISKDYLSIQFPQLIEGSLLWKRRLNTYRLVISKALGFFAMTRTLQYIKEVCSNDETESLLSFVILQVLSEEIPEDFQASLCLKRIIVFGKRNGHGVSRKKAKDLCRRFKTAWAQCELLASVLAADGDEEAVFASHWPRFIVRTAKEVLVEGKYDQELENLNPAKEMLGALRSSIVRSYKNHQEIFEYADREQLEKEVCSTLAQMQQQRIEMGRRENEGSSIGSEDAEARRDEESLRSREEAGTEEEEEEQGITRGPFPVQGIGKGRAGKRRKIYFNPKQSAREQGIQRYRRSGILGEPYESEEELLLSNLYTQNCRIEEFKSSEEVAQRFRERIGLLICGPPRNPESSLMENFISFAREFCSREASVLVVTSSIAEAWKWKSALVGCGTFETDPEVLVLVEDTKKTVYRRDSVTVITKFVCVAHNVSSTTRDRIKAGTLNLSGTGPQMMEDPNMYHACTNVISGCTPVHPGSLLRDAEGNPLVEDQLSVPLLKELICRYSRTGHIVCDPFAGSFSTASACIITGRRFIGCEPNKEVFDEAQRVLRRVFHDLRCIRKELRMKRVVPSLINSPPWVRAHTDMASILEADCKELGVEVRKSTIPNAGKGLFALRAFQKEEKIGYYWGRFVGSNSLAHPSDDTPLSAGERERMISVKAHKFLVEDGTLREAYKEFGDLILAGSIGCAMTYANCGSATTTNAKILEWVSYDPEEFDEFFEKNNADAFADHRMLCMFAKRRIEVGEEILIRYENDSIA